jgi:hypothetical protein
MRSTLPILLFLPAAAMPGQTRKATIMSEGTRMAAEVWLPPDGVGGKSPCILMAHGWGGTVAALRRDAEVFAKTGYYVAAFDYRGWGASESRLIATQPAKAEQPGAKFTTEVQEVREVVDPIDFGIDWLNAIHWIAGEPECDINKLGLWGSSYSGGLVVWAAARDARVKALHSQVGAFDSRFVIQTPEELARTREESTRRARGEVGYPAPRAKVIGNLIGAPIRSKLLIFAPVDDAHLAPECAMQFVIAENEELFDNRDHAIRAHERAKGPKRLVSIPKIKHYGIYFEARKQAQDLAIEWFNQHLR